MRKIKLLTRILTLILVITLGLTICEPATVSAANTGWQISENTEIFWLETADSNYTDEALKAQIQLFDSELAEKITTTALSISYDDSLSSAGENDIILVLDSSLDISGQGYKVEVSGSNVIISASDADGLFYGCRNLIQQILINGSVSAAESAPDVPERALSLDNGRKYYTVDWIKETIREMSWSNMNALVLHFSEEMGLGIESKTYPWLAGRDGSLCTQAEVDTDNRYLTQEEVAEIVEYAKLYHVEIIPSFDSPGHMNYTVKKFNEKCAKGDYTFIYNGKEYTAKAGNEIGNYYHYDGKTAIVQGSRNNLYSRGIDISNEVAVAFTQSLITEYATFFKSLGCTKFDIGGDELLGWGSAVVPASTVSRWKQLDHWKAYAQKRAKAESNVNWENAVAYDGFIYYMNDLYDLVTGLGYTSVRIWNDDALRSSDTGWNKVATLNPNIEILYWTTTSSNSIWTYLNAGHKAHNYLSDYNYYAMTSDYFAESRGSFTQAYADQIYNEWTPFTFDPASTTLGTGKNTALGNPNVLGSAFAIWSDNPTLRDEGQVMEDVLPMLQAHGAKAWDAQVNESVGYDAFTTNLIKLGDAPAGGIVASDITWGADISKLKEAIDNYGNVDASSYTAESFASYTITVNKAKELLDGSYTQTEVDAALTGIQAAVNNLHLAEKISDVKCFVQGAFKASKVYVGKVATLNVSTKKDVTVVGFEIYNDSGKEIEIIRYTQNTSYSDRNRSCLIFKPSADERGERTYTIRAILEDGTLSADFMQFGLTVK